MNRTILHIAPTPFFADRGCHIRIEGIVRCLTQLDYQNLVCTYHHGRDLSDVSIRRIKPIPAYTQTAAGPSKYKLLADWRLLWLAFSEYRRLKPVAIHAHLHEGLLIGVLIKTMMFWRRTPLIADMQGSLTGELDAYGKFDGKPWLRFLTSLFERILLWFPNHVVCSSNHSLTKLRAEFGLSAQHSSLAQDGANEPTVLSEAERHSIRSELTLPAEKVIVVYSGALLESKGLPQLKSLIKSSDDDRIHFLLIGYPVEEVEAFLSREGLQGRCTLTGQVPFSRLPKLLQASDIAIDPKNSDAGEGSGKMLNYLAAGLPVVAFDTANNREYAPPGAALADNSASLARNLRRLVADAQSRQQAGQDSLSHFRENYSWSVTQDQLQAVYQKLDSH